MNKSKERIYIYVKINRYKVNKNFLTKKQYKIK